MRHHLLIAGTGRAGTSLLVQILDACGLETQLARHGSPVFWDKDAHAGIEDIPVLAGNHPYVVKSPFSYQFIRELLERPDITLDGVLIPVRDLEEAVASRVVLELRHRYEHQADYACAVEDTWHDWGTVAGGVTYSLEPLDQARILAHSLHRIVERLVDREIPIHFLKFPKFAHDIAYLHRRLQPLLPGEISLCAFTRRVAPVIDPGKVRVSGELAAVRKASAGATAGEACGPHDGTELPAFEVLDQIALKRELRSMVGKLRQITRERDDLVSQCTGLTADRNGLLAERDALATERAELQARLAQAVAEQKNALARFDRLVNSTTWKLTQPMRAAVTHARKLRGTAGQQRAD